MKDYFMAAIIALTAIALPTYIVIKLFSDTQIELANIKMRTELTKTQCEEIQK